MIAVVVAFAPGFVWPLVRPRCARDNRSAGPDTVVADNTLKVQGIAAVLMGLFGFAMIGSERDKRDRVLPDLDLDRDAAVVLLASAWSTASCSRR